MRRDVVLLFAVAFAATGLLVAEGRAQTQPRQKPVAPPTKAAAPAPAVQQPAAPQTPPSTQAASTTEGVTEATLGVP
ncbi:MAG: hypothetical protein EHM24_06400, partial [Acidobacteria bacterium]